MAIVYILDTSGLDIIYTPEYLILIEEITKTHWILVVEANF